MVINSVMKVLYKSQRRFGKAYGKYGFCYRIGGGEFCAILDKRIESMNELELDFGTIMAKKRLKESRLPTVSIGSSIFEPGKMTFQEAIANADENMYEAKKKARRDVILPSF